MKKLTLVLSIALLVVSTGYVFALENATNTNTTDSATLGFAPTLDNLIRFTDSRAGTIFTKDLVNNVVTGSNYAPNDTRSPGALTDNPFKCVNNVTNFGMLGTGPGAEPAGCNTGDGNNPQTAPNFDGHTATGHIVVDIPMNVQSVSGGITTLAMSGQLTFDLNTDTNKAKLNMDINQNLNLGVDGSQNVTIGIASAQSPVEFDVSTIHNANPTTARNLPWTLDITQKDPDSLGTPAGSFEVKAGGNFPYANPVDGSINTVSGLTGSSFPSAGSFSLPGFGGTETANFPKF